MTSTYSPIGPGSKPDSLPSHSILKVISLIKFVSNRCDKLGSNAYPRSLRYGGMAKFFGKTLSAAR